MQRTNAVQSPTCWSVLQPGITAVTNFGVAVFDGPSNENSRCTAVGSHATRTISIATTCRANELLTKTTAAVFNGQISF